MSALGQWKTKDLRHHWLRANRASCSETLERVRHARLVYDPLQKETIEQTEGVTYRELADLLRESDLITLHPALSKETHHLIGERELSLMQPTAFLVNTSRGPIIDEKALVKALQEGRIAGAGLMFMKTSRT